MTTSVTPSLDRRTVVAELLRDRGDLLVVSGLGGTTWDVASVRDHALNFYLWGGMGNAVPMALGLALSQPSRCVLVVTGDGEMLMGLGSFATVAVQKPSNLAIAVIDNERYGETGHQRTHSGLGSDLAAIGRGAGIEECSTLMDLAAVSSFRDALHRMTGPRVGVIKVAPGNAPMVLPPRDGVSVKHRFRRALCVAETTAAN